MLDCFSRKVAGWSIAGHMRTGLVTDALQTAASTRDGPADNEQWCTRLWELTTRREAQES